jgi:hypothetical protein
MGSTPYRRSYAGEIPRAGEPAGPDRPVDQARGTGGEAHPAARLKEGNRSGKRFATRSFPVGSKDPREGLQTRAGSTVRTIVLDHSRPRCRPLIRDEIREVSPGLISGRLLGPPQDLPLRVEVPNLRPEPRVKRASPGIGAPCAVPVRGSRFVGVDPPTDPGRHRPTQTGRGCGAVYLEWGMRPPDRLRHRGDLAQAVALLYTRKEPATRSQTGCAARSPGRTRRSSRLRPAHDRSRAPQQDTPPGQEASCLPWLSSAWLRWRVAQLGGERTLFAYGFAEWGVPRRRTAMRGSRGAKGAI